ncbi:MAG: helix-turn-helix domain-containing protein [Melioribacteraceae bacterium]|nr:helix-turn-helix domain-containing protein [Melioribacteraceae bacterium]MCF8395098.1 helix-turn-helix domain-containing protein [Melioribacteraceae bacterium]MCF8420507.1 helix-turn-helix domain-containing protein [Melioribacteraceae bacterium]
MNKSEEIRFLLHTHGIKYSWLASRLNMNTRTITYLINESPNLDEVLYEKIKAIIDTYQFELELFEEEEKQELNLFDDDKIRLSIGERIRIFAKKKYGTLKKLADTMEISPQQLQQYISGRREPGSKILVKLLRLGCDINWLLGGNEKAESYRLYKLESELKKLHHGVDQISSIIQKLDATH